LSFLRRGHGGGKPEVPDTNIPDIIVHVVDDDESTRELLCLLLKTVGLKAATYPLPSAFIEKFDPDRPGCVVLDLRMPEANGVETLAWLRRQSRAIPVVLMSGYGDLSTVVRAMKLGAVDFLEKPFNKELLVETIQRWVRCDVAAHRVWSEHKATLDRIATLSGRERQVLDCVLDGMSNKETARHLGVSPKAIEIYRGHLMRKMEADNVVKLVLKIAGCMKREGLPAPLSQRLNRNEIDEPMNWK
jgi:two-component system, LuxR family, response regulator FixJ